MKPYLHELVKMAALATALGLLAHEWFSVTTSLLAGFACLWALTARAG